MASSQSQKDILLNQIAAQYNLNPTKHMMFNPYSSFMMPPNPDFIKLLYGNNSFSSLQANFNMMNNAQESETLPKPPNPLIPPSLNPLTFMPKKPPNPFDVLSKIDLGTGINQNVSPASGMSNILKERMGCMMPSLMSAMSRFGPQDDAEQASLNNRPFGLLGFQGLMNRPKMPAAAAAEKKVITIYDEDEEVIECKPEEFKKNVEKSKENRDQFHQRQMHYFNRNNQFFSRHYNQKSTPKRSIKSFISIDDSSPHDETKLKFFTTNNSLLKKGLFKKKTKKGFLSHRKKHRNQKRREKFVLNCKKCNSRIVILIKKTQIPEHKIKDRLCKNCIAEQEENLTNHLEKKTSNNIIHPTNKYNTTQKKLKEKEEESESNNETISNYKDLMFANSNRILLGDGYQAAMPEFILNKPQKMKEWRTKTMELLKSNKIWNPSEENSKLYDEVYQLICSMFQASYSHYEFVSMIDQYEGDLKLIKEKLEAKDDGLINLINEAISTTGKKRVTRSSKNKFRKHDFS